METLLILIVAIVVILIISFFIYYRFFKKNKRMTGGMTPEEWNQLPRSTQALIDVCDRHSPELKAHLGQQEFKHVANIIEWLNLGTLTNMANLNNPAQPSPPITMLQILIQDTKHALIQETKSALNPTIYGDFNFLHSLYATIFFSQFDNILPSPEAYPAIINDIYQFMLSIQPLQPFEQLKVSANICSIIIDKCPESMKEPMIQTIENYIMNIIPDATAKITQLLSFVCFVLCVYINEKRVLVDLTHIHELLHTILEIPTGQKQSLYNDLALWAGNPEYSYNVVFDAINELYPNTFPYLIPTAVAMCGDPVAARMCLYEYGKKRGFIDGIIQVLPEYEELYRLNEFDVIDGSGKVITSFKSSNLYGTNIYTNFPIICEDIDNFKYLSGMDSKAEAYDEQGGNPFYQIVVPRELSEFTPGEQGSSLQESMANKHDAACGIGIEALSEIFAYLSGMANSSLGEEESKKYSLTVLYIHAKLFINNVMNKISDDNMKADIYRLFFENVLQLLIQEANMVDDDYFESNSIVSSVDILEIIDFYSSLNFPDNEERNNYYNNLNTNGFPALLQAVLPPNNRYIARLYTVYTNTLPSEQINDLLDITYLPLLDDVIQCVIGLKINGTDVTTGHVNTEEYVSRIFTTLSVDMLKTCENCDLFCLLLGCFILSSAKAVLDILQQSAEAFSPDFYGYLIQCFTFWASFENQFKAIDIKQLAENRTETESTLSDMLNGDVPKIELVVNELFKIIISPVNACKIYQMMSQKRYTFDASGDFALVDSTDATQSILAANPYNQEILNSFINDSKTRSILQDLINRCYDEEHFIYKYKELNEREPSIWNSEACKHIFYWYYNPNIHLQIIPEVQVGSGLCKYQREHWNGYYVSQPQADGTPANICVESNPFREITIDSYCLLYKCSRYDELCNEKITKTPLEQNILNLCGPGSNLSKVSVDDEAYYICGFKTGGLIETNKLKRKLTDFGYEAKKHGSGMPSKIMFEGYAYATRHNTNPLAFDTGTNNELGELFHSKAGFVWGLIELYGHLTSIAMMLHYTADHYCRCVSDTAFKKTDANVIFRFDMPNDTLFIGKEKGNLLPYTLAMGPPTNAIRALFKEVLYDSEFHMIDNPIIGTSNLEVSTFILNLAVPLAYSMVGKPDPSGSTYSDAFITHMDKHASLKNMLDFFKQNSIVDEMFPNLFMDIAMKGKSSPLAQGIINTPIPLAPTPPYNQLVSFKYKTKD